MYLWYSDYRGIILTRLLLNLETRGLMTNVSDLIAPSRFEMIDEVMPPNIYISTNWSFTFKSWFIYRLELGYVATNLHISGYDLILCGIEGYHRFGTIINQSVFD